MNAQPRGILVSRLVVRISSRALQYWMYCRVASLLHTGGLNQRPLGNECSAAWHPGFGAGRSNQRPLGNKCKAVHSRVAHPGFGAGRSNQRPNARPRGLVASLRRAGCLKQSPLQNWMHSRVASLLHTGGLNQRPFGNECSASRRGILVSGPVVRTSARLGMNAQPRGILVSVRVVRISDRVHSRAASRYCAGRFQQARFKTGCTAAWHLCFT